MVNFSTLARPHWTSHAIGSPFLLTSLDSLVQAQAFVADQDVKVIPLGVPLVMTTSWMKSASASFSWKMSALVAELFNSLVTSRSSSASMTRTVLLPLCSTFSRLTRMSFLATCLNLMLSSFRAQLARRKSLPRRPLAVSTRSCPLSAYVLVLIACWKRIASPLGIRPDISRTLTSTVCCLHPLAAMNPATQTHQLATAADQT
mmetsp:Transcript_7637/g.15159  ORF Transcript_7637/g.15159 Transcript_7637/m.15159 type:complete len:203 (-) Transcript_7637:749-1357(-)